MKCRNWLLIPLFILLLGFSIQPAQAQEEDPGPMFIWGLVQLSINHDLMAGKNEVRDLTALKDYVDEYYSKRAAAYTDQDSRDRWDAARKDVVKQIDDKISAVVGRDMLDFFIDIFSDSDDSGADGAALAAQRLQVLSGSDDPPDAYINTMQSTTLQDIETQVNVALDLDIMRSYPSLAPAIADDPGWSYNVPAVSDSTSPVSPTAGNDDDSGGADFWGDASDGSGGVGDSSAPISGGDSASGMEDDGVKLRPLRFSNNGFEPVTVVVETYEPAPGYSPNKPNVSTVVFPESNPSAYMELPLGTYTFCYYWQLDEDYNNDDYFDYHHRMTSSVTLNVNSSEDPQSANAVTLSPDSEVSNPNGKCGEAPAQNQNTSGLTPEEQANAGTHNYLITCTGIEWCEGESDILTLQTVFSSGGVTITEMSNDGDPQYFAAAGINTYSWTNSYGDVFILIFTMDGFTYSADYDSGAFYYTLQP
jgi:hypothetical protein